MSDNKGEPPWKDLLLRAKDVSAPDIKIRLDIFKFYQKRIETIRSRLWTNLVWIASVQGAIIAFIVDNLIDFSRRKDIEQPDLVLVLDIFGAFLSWYTILVINDGINHIENDEQYADCALNPQEYKPKDAKDDSSGKRFAAFELMRFLAILTAFAHVLFATFAFVTLIR